MRNFAIALILSALIFVLPAAIALAMGAAMGLFAMCVGMLYSALFAFSLVVPKVSGDNIVGMGIAITFAAVPLGIAVFHYAP